MLRRILSDRAHSTVRGLRLPARVGCGAMTSFVGAVLLLAGSNPRPDLLGGEVLLQAGGGALFIAGVLTGFGRQRELVGAMMGATTAGSFAIAVALVTTRESDPRPLAVFNIPVAFGLLTTSYLIVRGTFKD